MATQKIDGITFRIKKKHKFPFLRKYGKVFCVFDATDSDNISFGTDNGENKYFIKVAGAKTMRSQPSQEDAIETLRASTSLYAELAHPHLIEMVEHFAHDDLYVVVFKWADGDCLFDYWNFDYYAKHNIASPRDRFAQLPRTKKLNAFRTLFDFLLHVEEKSHVAVDFYDGSIMYDFARDCVTICDIDFFRKAPAVNDVGEDFWGTKRLKSPEEYLLGAPIDAATNVFTLGALILSFFGSHTDNETDEMYQRNAFRPSKYETWELSEALYKVALKAVAPDREKRYSTIRAFGEAWEANLDTIKD
ncbi:MAG: hypothetical protein FWE40_09490 [Oscillospiraceae bacterium]|nr:hypothetical protein [Oscillospiraceae bacterium]